MGAGRRVAVIGGQKGLSGSEEFVLDCFEWENLTSTINISDYHIVVIDLLTLGDPTRASWGAFVETLTHRTLLEVLTVGGIVIVLGDPRFEITWIQSNGHPRTEEFLFWTGLEFDWDCRSGQSLQYDRDVRKSPRFEQYLSHLDGFEYAVRFPRPIEDMDSVFMKGALEWQALNVVSTKYHAGVVWSLLMSTKQKKSSWGAEFGFPKYLDGVFGPVLFLPRIELPEGEALRLVLRDFCGIETKANEPVWANIVKVPGQEIVDCDIADASQRITELKEELRKKEEEREQLRFYVRALYDRGGSLELVVRKMLEEIGATHIAPAAQNKEDAIIKLEIDGETRYAVVEIKGSANESFGEKGPRQLVDWRTQAMEKLGRPVKAVFIGNHSCNLPLKDRSDPFSDSFRRNCVLNEIAALTTMDIWTIWCQFRESGTSTHDFWKRLLATDGVFEL